MAYTLKGKLQAIIDGLGTPAGADLAADIAAIKSVVDALDTATLQTLIEAIQGTGFSDVTDSLKVISDNVDIVDGLVDAIKAKTDNLPASPCATADVANALVDVKHKDIGATFDPATDSLEAISNKIDQALAQGAAADVSADITPTGEAIVIPEGYHDGAHYVTADANLVTGNIKAGVTVYGVAGKTEVVDTTEVANAAAEGDIANGKVAFVNGVKITGTHV